MHSARFNRPARPLARLMLVAILTVTALGACAGAPPETPANPLTRDPLALGRQRLAQGEPVAAAEQFSLVIDAYPTLIDGWIGRAQASLALNEEAGALNDLNEALAIDPANPLALTLRAATLENMANHAAALTDLNALLAIEPNNADAHILRGSVLIALGRAQDAETDFQTALRLRPNAATILAMQAIAYAQSGKRTAAEADLSRALQLGLPAEDAIEVRKVIDQSPTPQP